MTYTADDYSLSYMLLSVLQMTETEAEDLLEGRVYRVCARAGT